MAAGIDRRDLKRVGESVERQRARQADHMATIDEPASEAAFAFTELVEMNARRVLVQPRRHHVLGFFDRHAVDMVDLLADRVVVPRMRAAGKRKIVGGFEFRREMQIL